MNKFFSLFILLSINSLYAMEIKKGIDIATGHPIKTIEELWTLKVPGSPNGKFTYEAMQKTVGPSYDLTTQSHCVPHYRPEDRDERFLGGAHPDYQDDTLHEAVRNDNVNTVSELLKSGKYSANRFNRWGSTPIFYVRSVAMTLLLMKRGAMVNAVEQLNGNSPLHFIVQNKEGEKELARTLLEQGADINALSWNYTTPLTMAKHGRPEIVEFLKSKGAEDSFETLDVIHKAKPQS